MKRIGHSIIGMTVGWGTLQYVLFLYCLGESFMKGRWMSGEDVLSGGTWLIIFAICSGVVCLVAWVVVYLPVYWLWPRGSERWKIISFVVVGLLGGALCGLIVSSGSWYPVIPPALVGAVSAFVGWRREQREVYWKQRLAITTAMGTSGRAPAIRARNTDHP